MIKSRPLFTSLCELVLVSWLCGCQSGEAQVGVPPDPDPDAPEVILWPNAQYLTLQSAVDALKSGGTLQIDQGRHEVAEPVTITKVLRIQGAGACDMARNDLLPTGGEEPDDQVTDLVGPTPSDVADADDAVGLLNYVGPEAGGVVRRLNLSGFDTGIRSRDDATTGGVTAQSTGSLVVEQVCIENTGRGVTWLGSNALSMFNSAILNTLWNAVTLAPRFVTPGSLQAYTFWGMQIHQAGNWCIYRKNGLVAAHRSWFVNCSAGGIYVEDGGLSVDDSVFSNLGGPGVAVLRSGAYVENNSILGTEVAGVILHTAGPSNLIDNDIDQTASIEQDGAQVFGDGIITVSAPHVVVDNNNISNSARAGISSYGATVHVLHTTMQCQSIDVIAAEHLGSAAVLNDVVGNTCGCPQMGVSLTGCMRNADQGLPPPVGGLE